MQYLVLLWCSTIAGVGLWLWFLRHVFKKFGLEGMALKTAILIDGVFLTFVVASHQLPGMEVRQQPGHFEDESMYVAFALLALWAYLFVADRPMRWLMKPPVNWAIYSMAILFYVCAYCAERGWF